MQFQHMVCNVIARYCKRIILSSSERNVNPNQYQCNNLLLSSGIEDNWRVAISPWVVLLRILEQMDQLHNLEYPVSILGVLASISRIGTAITIILRDRPQISLPQFCDGQPTNRRRHFNHNHSSSSLPRGSRQGYTREQVS